MSLEIALERIKSAQENKDTLLDLSNLGLTQVPSEIAELPQLKYLFLENNQLREINALEPLAQLEILSLGKNQLVEIPTFLLDLSLPFFWKGIAYSPILALVITLNRALARALDLALARDLDLARDLARDLDLALDLARDLERDLAGARAGARDRALALAQARDRARALARDLERARDLAQDLERARDLALARARARDLARVLDRALARDLDLARDRDLDLARDRDLDLARDRKRALERARALARALDRDHGIYLFDNPFQAPPPEIIKQGNDAVKTFLADFVEKEFLNEVKVILVGEGASGKTSLVKRILDIGFNKKEPQTHGIKILKHQFHYQEQDFLVNFWDFGGQEIMHATHQFFLTKRCLYVLVLDSRKDEKAEYWLNYIQSFGGDAPVIVVLNKNDENPSFDVNRKF